MSWYSALSTGRVRSIYDLQQDTLPEYIAIARVSTPSQFHDLAPQLKSVINQASSLLPDTPIIGAFTHECYGYGSEWLTILSQDISYYPPNKRNLILTDPTRLLRHPSWHVYANRDIEPSPCQIQQLEDFLLSTNTTVYYLHTEYQILAERGRRKDVRVRSETWKSIAKAMYQHGLSIRGIRAHIDIPRTTLQRWFSENGTPEKASVANVSP